MKRNTTAVAASDTNTVLVTIMFAALAVDAILSVCDFGERNVEYAVRQSTAGGTHIIVFPVHTNMQSYVGSYMKAKFGHHIFTVYLDCEYRRKSHYPVDPEHW